MGKANQITWIQAEEIATRAAKRATGFDKAEPGKKYTLDGEDVIRILENSAVIALREAGCLEDDDRRDREHNARLANAARREQDEWLRRQRRRRPAVVK